MMLPILLDPAKISVLLVGRGEGALRRLDKLAEDGVEPRAIFSDAPSPALRDRAGIRLLSRLPQAEDLAGTNIVYVVDLPQSDAKMIASRARVLGLLVNVEDDIDASDFHSPAVLRRGDLVLTISTGGKSPALARRIKLTLAEQFGPEWDDRLERLAKHRQRLRSEGRPMPEVASASEAMIAAGRWLAS
jgi:precorrin-2 dehydrogenase / sirohydrochlorin ferrochelatase